MAWTLTQMIADVREAAQAEKTLSVTDAEITKRLNEARYDLYDVMLDADPHFSIGTPFSFTLTTASNIQALPGTFYRMLGVDFSSGAGPYPQTLGRFNFNERSRYVGGNASGSYVVWFAPMLVELVNGGDTLGTIENNFKKFVTIKAAMDVIAKRENRDMTPMENALARQDARVRSAMLRRNIEPEQAPDVTRQAWNDFPAGTGKRTYSIENSNLYIWAPLY